jgi:cysteinyl-tRNA synthetase
MAPELSEEMKARIETLVAERQAKRRVKDWAASDRMRDELESLGVTLEDSTEGTKWELRR